MTTTTNRFEIVGHGRARELLKHVHRRASHRARRSLLLRDLRNYRPSARRSRATWLVSFLGDLQKHLGNTTVICPALHCVLLLQERETLESVPWVFERLRIRNSARVHLAHFETDRDARTLLSRFAEALGSGNEESILDAWWEGDTLIVLWPGRERFERLRVPLRALPPKLRHARQRDRENLEIDEHGDFVYWPAVDIHMGRAQFEQAVNPAARLRAQQHDDLFNRRYGRAIRSLRERHGLNQQGIEGLTDRTVRRIEKGATRATANAIRKLAAAHGMTPAEYMAELARLLESDPAA
jgi:hypothetical protein